MIELTRGQEWVLATEDGQPLTRLQMGVGWDKEKNAGFIGSGAPDVDLDASAVAFAGGQYADMAFYNNLATRDGSVVHLGDNQSGRGRGRRRGHHRGPGRRAPEGRHDRLPGQQLPGPHPGVGPQRLLPPRRRPRRRAGPGQADQRGARRPGWRWRSWSATARGGSSARSARGSRSRCRRSRSRRCVPSSDRGSCAARAGPSRPQTGRFGESDLTNDGMPGVSTGNYTFVVTQFRLR